jgi:hypothetical protein
MENLRMLSNLETRKHKLVQIILSGQPELDTKLSKPEWRQLVQRISLKRYSTNLSEEDTYRYVQHRLDIAGFKRPFLFNDEALNLIWVHSAGIPRKINIICDNALLIGYGIEKRIINKEIIQEAIDDLCWSPYLDDFESQDSITEKNQDFAHEQKEPTTPSIHYPNLEEEEDSASEEKLSSNPDESQEPKLKLAQTPDLKEVPRPLFEEKQAQKQEETLKYGTKKDQNSDRNMVTDDKTKNLVGRIRSSLVTRILIFICFIIATMYLFAKS